MKQEFKISTRRKRIAGFIIDHIVLTLLTVTFIFLTIGPSLMNDNNSANWYSMMFLMIPALLIYLAKDSYKGISLGKWIVGIMVRSEEKPNETPSFGRLFIRNIFIILWPIEFLVLIFSKNKKRIGDRVSKAIVVNNPNKPKRLIRIATLIGVIAISYLLINLISGYTIKSSKAYEVATNYIESNESLHKEFGNVKSYGMLPSGGISVSNGYGSANFKIHVSGTLLEKDVQFQMAKEPQGKWMVINAYIVR